MTYFKGDKVTELIESHLEDWEQGWPLLVGVHLLDPLHPAQQRDECKRRKEKEDDINRFLKDLEISDSKR